MICVDNTLMQGQPWAGVAAANGAAITAFNAAIADDPRVEQVLIPLRDGLTLIRRVVRRDRVKTGRDARRSPCWPLTLPAEPALTAVALLRSRRIRRGAPSPPTRRPS